MYNDKIDIAIANFKKTFKKFFTKFILVITLLYFINWHRIFNL